ncbi:hypothetical protein C9374_002293 [Naegleria lovaniensis]|uniref:Uncharacterized protein n=1 Tax=Naegleria lovaniensis TaxID=51637 RepID=A0AA88GUU1_NAELO|nr:uncharacterized protein C9374_002293 [Naegleria lovaniensis]KAG2386549.1 hypothetical protein C9374_002293 [Naegleria lovaniensis]
MIDLSFSQYTWLYYLSFSKLDHLNANSQQHKYALIEYIEYLYKNYYFGWMGKDETLIYLIDYFIEKKKEIIDTSYIPIFAFKIMIKLEQEILFYDILKRLLKMNEFNLSLSYQQAMYIMKSKENKSSLLIHSLYQIHELYRRKFLKNKLHQFIIRLKVMSTFEKKK